MAVRSTQPPGSPTLQFSTFFLLGRRETITVALSARNQTALSNNYSHAYVKFGAYNFELLAGANTYEIKEMYNKYNSIYGRYSNVGKQSSDTLAICTCIFCESSSITSYI